MQFKTRTIIGLISFCVTKTKAIKSPKIIKLGTVNLNTDKINVIQKIATTKKGLLKTF